MRKPFYRKSLKCWYVKDRAGKFIRLDADEEKAHKIWQRMLDAGDVTNPNATFLAISEAFLDEHQSLVQPAEYERWIVLLDAFICSIGPSTVWRNVTVGTVAKWLQSPKPGRQGKMMGPPAPVTWGLSRQRQAGSLIKRIFRWAHHEGLIMRNMTAELKLPESDPRVALISPEVHRSLIENCRSHPDGRAFATYLIGSHCGARPGQIQNVTALNVRVSRFNHDGTEMEVLYWTFEKHKTRGKTKKHLAVHLSPCLQTLTRILMTARPCGPLFLNSKGTPWKKDTVCQRMERLRTKLGLGPEVIAYAYRHTLATDALAAGEKIATVATLLGHVDTRMVAKVYGHLELCDGHLVNAIINAQKARFKKPK